MAITRIGANGLSLGPATTISTTTAQNGANVNPEQLGFSIYDSKNFTSSNGFISINSSGLANTLNLHAATVASNTVIPSLVQANLGLSIFDTDYFTTNSGFVSLNPNMKLSLNVGAPTGANSAVRFSDLVSLPADLLITALGSLDIQFTSTNQYTSSVDVPGTPSYISNKNNMTLVGNASSLGTNYSVIDSVYQYGNDTDGDHGQVTFTIDMALASNLSSSKFQSDGVTINPEWKGNYSFEAFSALFKLNEINFWDYPGLHQTFAYQVNLIPKTTDYTSSNWGKYDVTVDVYAAKTYHNANLGARWMSIATKKRNLFAFIQQS